MLVVERVTEAVHAAPPLLPCNSNCRSRGLLFVLGFLSVLVKYVYLGSTSGIIISSTFVNCHVPKVLLCKLVLVAFLFIHILKMATVWLQHCTS